jgi:hypothetical protein
VELTVQEDLLEYWPETPLPTDYWDRPINHENRDWWRISGNWLWDAMTSRSSTGSVNLYTTAPNTAHIVWTKEITFGGIVGGEFGSMGYYTGMTYESKWGGMDGTPIIMNGRLYYNTRLGSSAWQGLACIDLRTGEEIWWKNGTTVSLGQLYDYESPNQHGIIPYLWKSPGRGDPDPKWQMYDAITGDWILTLENASSGTIVFSPAGDVLVYILNGMGNWLAMWNSSCASYLLGGPSGSDAWQWRPKAGTYDWKEGVQWNVTVPDVPPTMSITNIRDGVIIASASVGTDVYPHVWMDVGYNAKTGEQMWVENRTYTGLRIDTGPILDGVYTVYDRGALHWYGYDANTGKQLWGPTEPLVSDAWDIYTHVGPVAAFGKLFSVTYGGVHAFDIEDGTPLWSYSSGNSELETPYGTWPFWWFSAAADGKVYVPNGEHSPTMPLYKGEQLHCIDASTGERVWSVKGWYQNPAIADGYLVAFNHGDNQLYCFGKGQTETTVSASPKVSANGDSVLIEGTVLDQSPDAEGTPAIADEYMTEWMEYLYMQQPCPESYSGVPVRLEAFGEDGSYIDIGWVTSDPYGDFKSAWTPPDEGLYTIMATFAGSDSYWSSYDATGLSVGPAPAPSGPIQPEPTEPTEAPLITTETAIIVAAVIVAVAVIVGFWIIRKRK